VIRLYRAPFSTNVERVALALAHKGLPTESVWIDYADRTAVERISGQGLVPVIEDAGTVVADSRAILARLEERYPDRPLYPRDRARRAEVELFTDWFDRVWKVAPNALERELATADPDEDRLAEGSAAMVTALDRFEALLTGRKHLFGAFSAADCVAFPFLKYALGRAPGDDEAFHRVLDEHQHLTDRHAGLEAWIRRVDRRPRA